MGNKRIAIAVLLAAGFCGELAAQATFTVTVSPPLTTVPVRGNQTVQLTWDVDPGVAVAASSTEGNLLDASGRLIRLVPVVLNVVGPGRVVESLNLAALGVAAAGAGSFLYQRNWADGAGNSGQAQARLALVGASAGALEIRALRLLFDDGSDQTRVVDQEGAVTAYAELSFSGRGGVIDYEWLLADPSTTRTTPVFVRIGQKRMSVRGASPLRIAAPPLPTTRTGPYQLQFRLREPAANAFAGGGGAPLLGYYVRPPTGSAAAAVKLIAPPERAMLAERGEFRWQALPEATVYQLELYDTSGKQRLTGVMLPAGSGDALGTALTEVARLRLADGCQCRWRVLAFDAQGELRGVSPMQAVVVPPQARKSN